MCPETTAGEKSETAIFSRVLQAHGSSFTPEAARSLLQSKFDQAGLDRMNLVAEKDRLRLRREAEQQELQSYLRAGLLSAPLHFKVRSALKQTSS